MLFVGQKYKYHKEYSRNSITPTREAGIKVNIDKTKYVFMSGHMAAYLVKAV
jgi:hypothetical protein